MHLTTSIRRLLVAILVTACLPFIHIASAAAQTKCPGGFIKNGQSCTPCKIGTYDDTGEGIVCKLADRGHYVSRVASQRQLSVTSGYYSPTTGASAPTPCPKGTYQNKNTSVSCRVCPQGKSTSSEPGFRPADCDIWAPVNTYWTPNGTAGCPSGTYASEGGTDIGACGAATNDEARYGAYLGSCPSGAVMKKISGKQRCKCKSGKNWSGSKTKCK